jgi:hypothetical protein
MNSKGGMRPLADLQVVHIHTHIHLTYGGVPRVQTYSKRTAREALDTASALVFQAKGKGSIKTYTAVCHLNGVRMFKANSNDKLNYMQSLQTLLK